MADDVDQRVEPARESEVAETEVAESVAADKAAEEITAPPPEPVRDTWMAPPENGTKSPSAGPRSQ